MPTRPRPRALIPLVGLLVGQAVLTPLDLDADTIEAVVPTPLLLSEPYAEPGADGAGAGAIIRLEGRKGAKAFADWPGLVAKGDYNRALTVAERYLKTNPGSGLAHEARGVALFMLGRMDEAQAAFRQATRVEQGQSGPWAKLGLCQMENNQLRAAEVSLTRAIAIDPGNRFAHQRLGMLYDYLDRDDEAIDHFRQGLVGTPSNYVGVAVDLGRLLNQSARYAETIEVLEPRLPEYSNLGQANFLLAEAYLRSGRFKEAQTRFARALELETAPARSRLGLAMAQRGQGELAAAMQTINQLVEAEPDSPLPYLERGAIHLAQDDVEQAAKDFERADRAGAGPLPGARRLAAYYVASEQPERAQRALESVVESGDADPEVYAQLSELYLSANQSEQGAQILERGLREHPGDSYLSYRLGSYLAATGQYDEALPWFERTLEEDPQNPNVMRSYSLALARVGQLAKSAEVAGELYAMRSDRPDVAVFYAARLEAAGKPVQAETIYRVLLEQGPESPLVLNNLASILSVRGEYDEAERLARRATTLVPGNGRLLDTLGWALYGKGSYREAADVLGKAASLQPQLGIIQFHYGMAAHLSGDRRVASAALSKALALEPEAVWAAEARERLGQLQSSPEP